MGIVNESERHPKIGDVYLVRFEGTGSEQRGVRPGLIFQNNVGNTFSPNVIALPLTSSIKKVGQPTHVLVPSDGTGLARDSVVLCENPERISKDRLVCYITTLPDEYMEQIAVASLLASAAISFIDIEKLVLIWEKAVSLNGFEQVA